MLDERTLVVGVSQSGETIDTLQALRTARRGGARIVAVCNIVDASMAREADAVLYTRAGLEIGVAATKTVLAQVAALELLALRLAQVRSTRTPAELDAAFDSLCALPEQVANVLKDAEHVHDVAVGLHGARDFFFIGRHVGYPVALEGALKLKELSYLHAEGYAAGELKHGPIALIEPGTVVVAIVTDDALRDKVLSNVAEVKARGASVVLLHRDDDDEAAALARLVAARAERRSAVQPRARDRPAPAARVPPRQAARPQRRPAAQPGEDGDRRVTGARRRRGRPRRRRPTPLRDGAAPRVRRAGLHRRASATRPPSARGPSSGWRRGSPRRRPR